MKIEVGKRYFRRDGSITPPLERPDADFADPNVWACVKEDDFPLGRVRYRLGECEFASYYLDQTLNNLQHPRDLIAEYAELALVDDTNPDVSFSGDNFKEPLACAHPKAEGTAAILNERGTTYGEFHNRAALSQSLSDIMTTGRSWPKLSPAQREALQMIQHKIARILNGDPFYLDSWVDIVGYAELGKRETERLGGK